jgi:hypothetical protein
MKNIDSLEARMKHPVLKEFAEYLFASGAYDIDDIESLLLKKWGDVYPAIGSRDNILADLGSFLWFMGDFVVERVVGESFPKIGDQQLFIEVIPYPNCEDSSYVYIIETTTHSFLVRGCGCRTWWHDPDSIAEDLKEIESKMKEGWELVKKRVLALDLLGTPTDLPFRKGQE